MGFEYLLEHYKAIFPWIEGGLDLIEEERIRRGRESADQGAQASATEAIRALTEKDEMRAWNKKLLERTIREASQDSHEGALRAAFSVPAVTPAAAESAEAEPSPPSYPPPSAADPSSSHGQTVVAPGSVQEQQSEGGVAASPPVPDNTSQDPNTVSLRQALEQAPPPKVAPILAQVKAPPPQVVPDPLIPPGPPPGGPTAQWLAPPPPPPPPPAQRNVEEDPLPPPSSHGGEAPPRPVIFRRIRHI